MNEDAPLPLEFEPEDKVVWKTALPPRHSSPIQSDDRIFVTAVDDDTLDTYCLDRATGELLWRRAAGVHRSRRRSQPPRIPFRGGWWLSLADFVFTPHGRHGGISCLPPYGARNPRASSLYQLSSSVQPCREIPTTDSLRNRLDIPDGRHGSSATTSGGTLSTGMLVPLNLAGP